MARNNHTFAEFSLPDTELIEDQLLAHLVNDCVLMREAQAAAVLPEWFSDPQKGKIFENLRDMWNSGQKWDAAKAFALIPRDYFCEKLATRVGEEVPGGFHGLCLELAKGQARRILYQQAYDYLKNATSMSASLESLLAMPGHLSDQMTKTFSAVSATRSAQDVYDLLTGQMKENEALYLEGKTLRVKTGIPGSLDRMMGGGWGPGQLVILAARPSVGKTAVMLQMARAAAEAGTSVDIFSLEMMNEELAKRLALSTGQVTPAGMEEGQPDWEAYGRAKKEIAGLPLYFHDDINSVDAIISRITLDHQQGKCGMAIIDHLGLMELHRRMGDNLSTAYEDATRRLKGLAKSLRIPILLLSQLNRESAKEKRPVDLFDLRNSGAIEQDADVVLMLERVEETATGYQLASLDSNLVRVWVRKNRNHEGAGTNIILEGDEESFTRFQEPIGEVHNFQTTTAAAPVSLMPTEAKPIEPYYNETDRFEGDLPF